MCFDFIGMQQMYLSLARDDAEPLADALRQRPNPPEDAHWATFVRNHDELTLDKLTDAQRQEVFDAFGPEPDMQLYGRGLRRRLPPMLDGDQRRIRMVYSLLFALPGTPVLFYGEEIGMGENLGRRGPARGAHPDAVDPGARRRLLHRRPVDLPGAGRRRPLRPQAGQRARPAARPGLAAVLDPAARRALPGLPGAGLGPLHGARPGLGRPPGAGAPLRLPTAQTVLALHNFGDADRRARRRCCRSWPAAS